MVRLSVCLVFVFWGIFCALSEDFADRAAFLLRGPVVESAAVSGDDSVVFSASGQLLALNGKNLPNADVVRSEGYIVALQGSVFDYDGGRLMWRIDDGEERKVVYGYDEEGSLLVAEEFYEDELNYRYVYFDILEDTYGNWLRRKVLAVTPDGVEWINEESRTIKYAKSVSRNTRLKRSSAELLSEIGGVWSLVSGTYYVPEMEVKLEFLPNSRCLWTEEGVRERYSVSLVRDSEIYWLVIGDCEWVFRAVCSGEYLFLYSTCNLASEPQLILRR